MLMSKNVNNYVSKDSPIDHFLNETKSGYELRPQSFLGSFGGTEQR